MSATDKVAASDTVQSIRFPVDEWEKIEAASEHVLERDHVEMSRAEFVRFATRRMVDHVLNGGSIADRSS